MLLYILFKLIIIVVRIVRAVPEFNPKGQLLWLGKTSDSRAGCGVGTTRGNRKKKKFGGGGVFKLCYILFY